MLTAATCTRTSPGAGRGVPWSARSTAAWCRTLRRLHVPRGPYLGRTRCSATNSGPWLRRLHVPRGPYLGRTRCSATNSGPWLRRCIVVPDRLGPACLYVMDHKQNESSVSVVTRRTTILFVGCGAEAHRGAQGAPSRPD